ncbi:serine hydrolase domain-containing protein [Aureispira anguillae]|nr:serine hydrolase [Aureispira anguillae]
MNEILYQPIAPNYWPTQKWKTSSPEEQGVNADKLVEMIAYYHKKRLKNKSLIIDSITIIRNEHIIADLYFNPLFPKDKKHIINSCTKSVLSILIGIAIKEGYIKNVSVPILEIFEATNNKKIDTRLEALTIKDLLTMKTGWHSQDSYLYRWVGLFKMQATEDWTTYILNLPFETSPNKRFDYSNMASFLLSAVLTRATGMDSLSFAQKHLFTPLGIKDICWDQSPKGIYIGFARMWLKPHDMAKIGLLYLQKGKWENQQIVPTTWVEASIKAHSFPKQYRYIYKENRKIDFGKSGGNWVFSNLIRPFTDGYGYQWWLDKSGIFSAIGVGGQYIMVMPKENLIVTVTSKLTGKDSFLPVTLLKNFIIPAIETKNTLAPNQVAGEKLSSYSTAPPLQSEGTKQSFKLPSFAKEITHKVYSLKTSIASNPWMHDHLMLEFDSNLNYAVFSYTLAPNKRIRYEVGLNNQYRISNCKDKSYAAIGKWTTPNTFIIDYELIGYSSRGKWILVFNKNEIEVTEIGMTGQYNYHGLMIKNS